MKKRAAAAGGQGQGRDRRLDLPEISPGGRVDGNDSAGLGPRPPPLVDDPLFFRRGLVTRHVGIVVGGPGGSYAEESFLGHDELPSETRLRKNSDFFAGLCIQQRDRRVDSQRHKDVVAGRNQSPRCCGGAALQGPKGVDPARYVFRPQDVPVKGIAGDERPFRRKVNRTRGTRIVDEEHPSGGTDKRGDGRDVVVVASALGAANPLDAARRTD